MVPVVIPFRSGGKTRLPVAIRREVALAMLGDVLEVAMSFGPTVLVTDDPTAALVAQELNVQLIDDPGGGQGAAVAAGLARIEGPCLVLNADTPCVTRPDLDVLAVPVRTGAFGLVAAEDGTTNALAFPCPDMFEPLFGPGSAARFREHARRLGIVWHDIALPNLRRDVDITDDLVQILDHAGPRTSALVQAIAAA